jgi:hypothetical protein
MPIIHPLETEDAMSNGVLITTFISFFLGLHLQNEREKRDSPNLWRNEKRIEWILIGIKEVEGGKGRTKEVEKFFGITAQLTWK